jgi:hypothetical protein
MLGTVDLFEKSECNKNVICLRIVDATKINTLELFRFSGCT